MTYLDNPLLTKKIDLLPDKPGSYQMKDKNGTIIYVGKAKSLVKRVKQYFTRPQQGKVMRMVMEIRDFDIIETSNEKEALLLEISLIHKYYPKYNILLMDDRMYPYISLKKKGEPYLKISRDDKDKNYYHFGPYPNSSSAYKMISLINKLYPIRKCKTLQNKPCIYYYMNQCLAPCVNKITDEQNNQLISNISRFLNGYDTDIITKLKKEMNDLSQNLEFEKAQEKKDLIDVINNVTNGQKIMFSDHVDRDVVSYSIRDGYIAIFFLLYRKGTLLGKKYYIEEIEDDIDDLVENVILQFYENHPKPKELLVPNKQLCEILTSSLDIMVYTPSRGKKKDLLILALENAKQTLDTHFMTARLDDDVLKLLEELQEKLDLDKTPLDIELYDNSHTQGFDCVSAMVKYINGVKAPSLYRKYKIRQENSQDDLASMKEVLTRRFTRLIEDKLKLPDLIIVDGGANQVNVAIEVRDEFSLPIKIAGLAKNDQHETDSLINGETGEIIPLDRRSPLFFLLMRMQDEVHRYAISFHRHNRDKSHYKTIYDDIKGIGKKRKEKMLLLYPTIESLETVTKEELINILPSQAIDEVLHKRDEFFKIRKENNDG